MVQSRPQHLDALIEDRVEPLRVGNRWLVRVGGLLVEECRRCFDTSRKVAPRAAMFEAHPSRPNRLTSAVIVISSDDADRG